MSNFSQIKRWEIIISLIRDRSFPSKKELMDPRKADFEISISPRTLERDLYLRKTEMGVENIITTNGSYFI